MESAAVREGLEVRKDHEHLADGRAPAGISKTGEHAVELVERGRVGRGGQPQTGEIGADRVQRCFGGAYPNTEVHGSPLHVLAGQAVHIAHLVQRRRDLETSPRLVDQPERVEPPVHRRVGPDRIAAQCHIGDGQKIVGSQTTGEREPRAGRIDVVVLPFDEQLPGEGPHSLRAVIPDGDRVNAAEIGIAHHLSTLGTQSIDARLGHLQVRWKRVPIQVQHVHVGIAGELLG